MPALQEAAHGRVIAYASRTHYADHLAPVVARLPPDLDVALVASYKDLTIARAKHRRIVLLQHGAGQSYSNDNPAYPGGRDNEAVGLFLVPGEHAAQRWRARYPAARVEVVGTPRLDVLPDRGEGPLTVAVSWHWNGPGMSASAFPWFRDAVVAASRELHLIGHGHPRRKDLPSFYAKHDIEYVPTFDEVCRRADVYVCDNSSTIFEFAATGRPVVLMNAPKHVYPRDVSHGLRFWDAAHVGEQVDHAPDLLPAIRRALEHRPEDIAAREDALEAVYTYRGGAAQRAADVIVEWAA
jgi:hypothetical protein